MINHPSENITLPQHIRPLAVQARLLALLDGLGIPHSSTWLVKPTKEFHKLGQMYLYKLQGLEPPLEEVNEKIEGEPEYDYTKNV